MNITTKQIKDYFNQLPENIKGLVLSVDIFHKLEQGYEKYQFSQPQREVIGSLTGRVLMGIIPKDEYQTALEKSVPNMTESVAQQFTRYIEDTVFDPNSQIITQARKVAEEHNLALTAEEVAQIQPPKSQPNETDKLTQQNKRPPTKSTVDQKPPPPPKPEKKRVGKTGDRKTEADNENKERELKFVPDRPPQPDKATEKAEMAEKNEKSKTAPAPEPLTVKPANRQSSQPRTQRSDHKDSDQPKPTLDPQDQTSSEPQSLKDKIAQAQNRENEPTTEPEDKHTDPEPTPQNLKDSVLINSTPGQKEPTVTESKPEPQSLKDKIATESQVLNKRELNRDNILRGIEDPAGDSQDHETLKSSYEET